MPAWTLTKLNENAAISAIKHVASVTILIIELLIQISRMLPFELVIQPNLLARPARNIPDRFSANGI